jgi:hypothetical protein
VDSIAIRLEGNTDRIAMEGNCGMGKSAMCFSYALIIFAISGQRLIGQKLVQEIRNIIIILLFSLALQPIAGYGLLWLCSPARAMAACGSAAQRGLWPLLSRGFVITHDAPQSVELLLTSDQLVAETST